MKYRIKQIGYKYYPQYKYFIFWNHFLKDIGLGKIKFFSHLEAYDFIQKVKLDEEIIKIEKENEKKVIIWEIE